MAGLTISPHDHARGGQRPDHVCRGMARSCDRSTPLTSVFSNDAGVQPILPGVPEGVEVCRRSGEGKSVLILINHNTSEEHISLPMPMRDLIGSQGSALTAVDLPGYGVAVLAAEK